jgi:bacteriocin biosynthesis cyclodehydratase domain-containing protein
LFNSTLNIVSNKIELLEANSFSMMYTMEARALATLWYPELNFKDLYAVKMKNEIKLNIPIDKDLIFSITERTKIFDQVTIDFLLENPSTTIVSLGCGLCSRAYRLQHLTKDSGCKWVNIDLAKVIAIRNSLYVCQPTIGNTSCEAIHEAFWLDELLTNASHPILIIMEGVSPYLYQKDLEDLLFNISEKVKAQAVQVNLLFDYCHPNYNYSDTQLNRISQKKVQFRAGFRNTNEVQKRASESTIVGTYNNLLKCNENYAMAEDDFKKQNEDEDPYTILNLRFKSKNGINSVSNPLSYFGKPVFWNKHFAQQKVANGNYLFLAEEDYFIYTQKEYKKVLSFLTNEKIIYSSFQEEILAVHLVNLFQEAGLLLETEQEQDFISPSFHASYKEVLNGNQELVLLTEIKQEEFLIELINGISAAPLHFVFVDDYLDPRLDALSRQFKRDKSPWMLLKVTGNQVMIGPLFTASEAQVPCYHCLEQHLWRNQPVRKWGSQSCTTPIVVPVIFSIELFLKNKKKIRQEIKRILDNVLQTELTCLNIATGEMQNHPVKQRNLCSHCGDSTLIVKNNLAPVELHTSIKTSSTDGGYRSLDQTEYIRSLECLANLQDQLSIYSTSFFKIPHRNPLLANVDFIQYSLGKGITEDQSKISALSESVERYNALYDGTEECTYEKVDQLDAKAFLPDQLKPYSEQQSLRFIQNPTSRQAVRKMPKNTLLHWTPAFSLLNQEKAYFPFTYCYANTPFEEEVYVRFDSNGCAAGNTLEEAILQGFLEVIERDAVAIWWYNKISRPAISLEDLNSADLNKIKSTLDENWEYWVLDLSHDFTIPVVVAIGKNKLNGEFRLGFGAHLEISVACTRALTELYQVIVINKQHKTIFEFQQIEGHPFLYPKANTNHKEFANYVPASNKDIKCDIEHCIEQTRKLGFDIFVVNTSRPDILLHTVKVIVPGLNFIWPELGNKRLYSLPVQVQWQSLQLSEAELNKHELFL